MPVLANAKLTQRRIVTGVSPALSFWTQESITLGIGSLVTPFKVLVAGTAETMTVAEYADVAPGGVLVTNPLNRLYDVAGYGTAAPGDELEISNPPSDIWGGVPSASEFRVVTAVDVDGIILASPFWTRVTGLTWTVRRLGTTVASGVAGVTQREDNSDGYFLENQFQSVFATPVEALNHLEYTQTMLDSLKAAIIAASNEYTAAPNPVTSTFTA